MRVVFVQENIEIYVDQFLGKQTETLLFFNHT